MELHKGHRERLKRRYAENGLSSFEEHNILELLLFYAYPRIDTNDIAHKLINKFGSLSGVLKADAAALRTVDGVGDNAALFLNLIHDIAVKYVALADETTPAIHTSRSAGEYLAPYMTDRSEECAYLLCLDKKFNVLCCSEISSGGLSNVNLSLRSTMEAALVTGSTYVILAHNHTSGVALPSQTDMMTTNEIFRALQPVGVYLLDHLIFGSDRDFVSMLDSGFLDRKRAAELPEGGYRASDSELESDKKLTDNKGNYGRI